MQPAQPSEPERLVVGPEHTGARLDRALADWRGLSRAAALRLIEGGAVLLNSRALSRKDKGTLLRQGDRLELSARYLAGEAPLPDEELALVVLDQGSGWVAVDKQAGVAVRPHAIDERGTVINALAARYPGLVGVGEGGLRSGVVHRLDTETSGVLLVAYEQAAWQRLRDAFAQHTVRKQYTALVHGDLPAEGEAALWLRVARHSPSFVEVCGAEDEPKPHPDSRKCSLSWHVTERFAGRASLVDVDLHTGFLHQVRVTMAHLGHAVIGDPLYNDAKQPHRAPRQMLHATSVALDEIKAAAPLPDDLRQAITGLGF